MVMVPINENSNIVWRVLLAYRPQSLESFPFEVTPQSKFPRLFTPKAVYFLISKVRSVITNLASSCPRNVC